MLYFKNTKTLHSNISIVSDRTYFVPSTADAIVLVFWTYPCHSVQAVTSGETFALRHFRLIKNIIKIPVWGECDLEFVIGTESHIRAN